jgi:predicted PurR-regulated permease PerM
MREKDQIEVLMGVVFRVIALAAGAWFLYLIREILVLFFVSILIVTAIDPVVDFLQRKKIPRSVGVSMVYVVLFSIFGLSIAFIIPSVIGQFDDFSKKMPIFLDETGNAFGVLKNFFQAHNIAIDAQQVTDEIRNRLAAVPSTIFFGTVDLVKNFISIIVILVMAFYMTVKEDGIKKFIVSITPEKHREYAAASTDRIEGKISRWVQGQLMLMLIIFVLDFVGLYLIGIPYALALALFAGVMEIIPYGGPIVSAIPGIILGTLISPLTGFITLLVYFFVQQFESHIIVPQVMKKAVGLNPVAVILALLVGLKLGGVLGAVLSIPLATVASVFISDFMKKHEM